MYGKLKKRCHPKPKKEKEKPRSISITFYNRFYAKLKRKKNNKPSYI